MPALCYAKTAVPVVSAPLRPWVRRSWWVGGLSAALLLSACGKTDAPGAGGPAGRAMPQPEVGVVTVALGDVGLITELPGRLEASRVAQVRARAAGILQKRLFREGSDVKAGQALFTIDAAPYAAALQSAQAQLARAQANLAQASALAERYQPLVAANAVSQQEYANAVAAQKQAEADLASAKAAVETARINLGYASVTAPISGRIGRALVTEGALVGQGEVTQLATIQQIQPVYVNFTQSASDVMRLRSAMDAGQLKKVSGQDAASVRVRTTAGGLFAAGSDALEPRARPLFERIGAAIEAEPGRVRVEGHADSDAVATLTFPDNVALSKARAEAAGALIRSRLSAPDRVTVEGFGASRPITGNDSPAGKALNRRVEVVLIQEATR